MPAAADDKSTLDERKQRVIIEKKTAINLVEAFAVAVKHYLRGEEGVYYVDLYHLVKFLPSYALPPGIPSALDVSDVSSTQSPAARESEQNGRLSDIRSLRSIASPRSPVMAPRSPHLPVPVASPRSPKRRTTFVEGLPRPSLEAEGDLEEGEERGEKSPKTVMVEEGFLLPALNPPKYHLLDFFPFSLFVKMLAKKGKDVKVCMPLMQDVYSQFIMSYRAGEDGSSYSCQAEGQDSDSQLASRDFVLSRTFALVLGT